MVPALRTTLHNLRLICRRTGLVESESPWEVCGPDGQWTMTWTRDVPPTHARCTVRRKDYPQGFTATVEYKHCVRWKNDGSGPTDAWVDGAAPQLGKCAVVAAHRMAFHEFIGNLYTREELEGERRPRPTGPRLVARRSRPAVLGDAAVGPRFPRGFARQLAASVGIGPDGELVDDPSAAARLVNDSTPDSERGLLLELIKGDRGKAEAEALMAKLKARLPRTERLNYAAFAAVVLREARAGRG